MNAPKKGGAASLKDFIVEVGLPKAPERAARARPQKVRFDSADASDSAESEASEDSADSADLEDSAESATDPDAELVHSIKDSMDAESGSIDESGAELALGETIKARRSKRAINAWWLGSEANADFDTETELEDAPEVSLRSQFGIAYGGFHYLSDESDEFDEYDEFDASEASEASDCGCGATFGGDGADSGADDGADDGAKSAEYGAIGGANSADSADINITNLVIPM
jgi:hypothetical protein